jgi:hypothetical protein
MPSWKKVIISGSNAALNSLTVTNGITGSLFGTASFASTASFLDSTTNAFIQNGNSFGTTALLGTNDNQSLALETSGSTRMFISSSGDVGIGTTSPTTKLHVTGITQIVESGNTAFYGGSYVRVFNDQNFNIRNSGGSTIANISVSGSSYFNGGNVGIGTTTPSFRLSVSASSSSDGIQVIQGGISKIELKGDGTTVWGSSADFGRLTYDTGKAILQAQSGKALSLGANNLSDHLYINTSANVGIGTTTPNAKLDISGSLNISGSGVQVPLQVSSGSTPLLFVSQSGNVGIGTTAPLSKLDVRGDDINIRVGAIGNYSSFEWNNSSGYTAINTSGSQNWPIYFRQNSQTRMTIAVTTGNVGIGTTTPNAKLDVSGSAIISGSFTVTPGTVREFQVNTTGVDIGNLITDTHTVTGSFSISGSLSAGISTIVTNRIAASSAGANIVFTQVTGSFTAAKYLYTVTSASNARTGEVMAVWNGTTVQYTDNSTLDIGTTTAVTASVSIGAAQAQFNMQTTNAGWTIKSQVTYL